MKIFRISGTVKMGANWQKFTKETLANGKDDAIHRVYSEMGGRHGVPRRLVKIENVEEIKPEEVTDFVIKGLIENKMINL